MAGSEPWHLSVAKLWRVGCVFLPLLMMGCRPQSVSPVDPGKPARVNPKDGTHLRYVPGGSFSMGSPEDVGELDEHPRHTVQIDPFYMAESAVTNAQFAVWINETYGTGPPPPRSVGFDAPDRNALHRVVGLRGFLWRPTEIRHTGRRYRASLGYEAHPVIAVSHIGAQAYCEWAGMRLPTEAEWERAARGGLKAALYPWGNDKPEGRAQFGQHWKTGRTPAPTAAVGSYSSNGFGLFDMAGNVWEWTSSEYESYDDTPQVVPPERHVLRGGSFFAEANEIRVAFRMTYPAPTLTNFVGGIGFRCVMNADAAGSLQPVEVPQGAG